MPHKALGVLIRPLESLEGHWGPYKPLRALLSPWVSHKDLGALQEPGGRYQAPRNLCKAIGAFYKTLERRTRPMGALQDSWKAYTDLGILVRPLGAAL